MLCENGRPRAPARRLGALEHFVQVGAERPRRKGVRGLRIEAGRPIMPHAWWMFLSRGNRRGNTGGGSVEN